MKCCSRSHPRSWAESVLECRLLEGHLPLLHSPTCFYVILSWCGQYDHMSLLWRESFWFWILFRGPRTLRKLCRYHHDLWMFRRRTLRSRGLWNPEATQVESWGEKWPLIFQPHNAIEAGLWFSEGPAREGFMVSPSPYWSKKDWCPPVDDRWVIWRGTGAWGSIVCPPSPSPPSSWSHCALCLDRDSANRYRQKLIS